MDRKGFFNGKKDYFDIHVIFSVNPSLMIPFLLNTAVSLIGGAS